MFFYGHSKLPRFPTLETENFLGIQQAAVSHAARQGATLAKKKHN
jgi:hypothetical protein